MVLRGRGGRKGSGVGEVGSLVVLKNSPNGSMGMLRGIAEAVSPLMRAHGWKVPVLAEFMPENGRLLGININRGQKICLRLRHNDNPSVFLEERDIMGTMLHELTHIEHGPHDSRFYAALDALSDEYTTLQLRQAQRGLNGYNRGFVGTGQTLGSIGGRVLGGAQAPRSRKQLREIIAEAAERRRRDEETCAAETEADVIYLDSDSDSDVIILD